MFTQFLIGLAVHEFTGYLASFSPADWEAAKASALAKIQALVHPAWLGTEAGHVVLRTLDALAYVCADQADTSAVLKDLAAKDFAAAEQALLAEVTKAVPELVPFVAAVTAAA